MSSSISNEKSLGYDCLQIPGAVKGTPTAGGLGGTVNSNLMSNYCGNLGLVTATGGTGMVKTICSK